MYELKKTKDRFKMFILFAFVPLFAFTTVLLIPFIVGLASTFTDWNGIQVSGFVGIKNYVEAFLDPDFFMTFKRTIAFVVFSVILVNIVAFLLALLVTSKIKAKNFLRSVFFVPNLIGGVLLGFIWQFIFSRILVYIGTYLGLETFMESWLVDKDKAFWALIIVTIWQQAGYMMLIYIAGLTAVSKDVLEAASIDGANKLKILFKIKIPLVMQSFTISVFLTLKNAFMMYDLNLSLTKGGPFRSTELLTMHIYNEAFLFREYGTAQAKAIILFLLVSIIAITQVAISKRLEVES